MASLAYVVSKRKFTGSWEYLLESAIFTAPPTLQWAGAALLSREGKLVGIGSLLVREALEGGSEVPGNMFVPIDLLKPILADLIEKGRRKEPPRPWLGLATEELHGHLIVTRVSPDGPADKAGIRSGDVVVGVGADPVKNHEELYRKVWGRGAAGVDVPLRILQGADLRELKLRSIDRFQYFREKPTY
jgi:S1-C subfamily serine protease